MDTLSIIGAGIVGSSIGYALHRSGLEISTVASRTLLSAQKAVAFIGGGIPTDDITRAAHDASIVFITTPDSVISEVCQKIATTNGFSPGTYLFHCSGALTSSALCAAVPYGAHIASLHPLQTFASSEEAVKNLAGIYFTFEGDSEAELKAQEIVGRVGGTMISIRQEDKPLYHAGAVCASNYIVTMISLAIELFDASGISRDDALYALMPLIKGTIGNIGSLGVPGALTGPVARGDVDTLQRHLEAMKSKAPHLEGIYREVAKHTIQLALQKGTLKPLDAAKIESLFD